MGLGPGTVLQETYEVLRMIGEGGMGQVYEARHRRLPGRFAVKVLQREVASNPEAFTRFQREAQVTSALRHPHIVQVVDFNMLPDGSPYLVMEYLEGTELAAVIAKGRMPLGRAVQITDQIASALQAAHDNGVVHRDLKPQNIILVPAPGKAREFAKVLDFGISKVRTATRSLTQDSTVMGTPQYMSPEQVSGRVHEIDGRTDQFALGAIVYEMLTGTPAFNGENLVAIAYSIMQSNPPLLGSLITWVGGGDVDGVLRRAMAKKKEDRFPIVLEFAEALEEAAGMTRPEARSSQAVTAPTLAAAPPARSPAHVAPATTDQTLKRVLDQKETTFRTSAGETLGSSRRPGARSKRRIAIAAVAALGGGAVALFLLGPFGHQDAPAPRAASAPVSSAPATAVATGPSIEQIHPTVRIDVAGAPDGVRVLVDGFPGKIPVVLPRAAAFHRLRFEAPGYAPREMRIDANVDRIITPSMSRQKTARPSKAPATTKKRASFVDDL